MAKKVKALKTKILAESPDTVHGRLLESVHYTGYGLERACVELEWLLEEDRWKVVRSGYDDIDDFLSTINFSEFKLAIDQRKKLAKKLNKLRATQRATAEALGVSQKTIDRDLESNDSKPPIQPQENQVVTDELDSCESKPESEPIIDISPITQSGTEAAIIVNKEAEKQAKKEKKAAENEKLKQKVCPLPEGTYSVILADPPWEYSFSRSSTREIENQYPTLSLDEIKNFICLRQGVPRKQLASGSNASSMVACGSITQDIFAKDCVLFLWVTSPKLTEGLEVLSAWGFTYKTCAVWDKEIIGMGYYFRQQHELLLVGTQGSLPVPEPAARVSSVIRSRRAEHSQKPTQLYEIIEKMYPGEPKLELFQREPRDGWAGHGNENL